ncbi:MAG: galactitol-1-phosphate 5-dehydrogenase [Thermoguttaceae bacterium]|jgi:L-iditol 2-dehydrogenase|nr:galactitol-1-phosphate 5-dehydrogenase [Thermoguttaceae bacterium]
MTQPTMNALVLHAVGDARFERVRRPVPAPCEVLVRVAFCGVCGSDIPRTFVKGTYRFPTICGHEFAGIVEECGQSVTEYRPGDRVVVFPLLWCGRCAACERGAFVMCSDYDYYGSRRDGAFAEYVAVPTRNLLRVPEGVSLEAASMTEPAAVALHALRRAGGGFIGQTVVIFGAGPIGLMTAQWARMMGAEQVVLFDLVPEKLAMAARLGFLLAFDPREGDPVEKVRQLTAGQGAEVCVEAAGVPATMRQAIGAARTGGRVVLLGNPSADVTLPAALISQAMRRELDLLGTWNSTFSPAGNNDDWHAVLSAVAAGRLDLDVLVTHRVPLENAFAALAMMRDQTEFFAKVLIKP